MSRKAYAAVLFVSALAASAFSGCGWLSTTFRPAPPGKPPAAAPATKPPAAAPAAKPPEVAPAAKPPGIPVSDRLFAEGMASLHEGGQEHALELFSAAWQEKPGHKGVAREFDAALLDLKKSGDAAYAQGKWEAAGKRWMGTLRFITHPAANWRNFPFTMSEVRSKVDRLNEAFMEKALTEYRRGDIQSAIVDWKKILSYDPGNEEAARSLRTASKQLETLKKMPPGK